MSTPVVNVEQARYWNGKEAAHWLSYEDRYEAMLAAFTARLLEAASLTRSDRVLDIGCGCGATTRAAGRVAAGGEAVGVDLSCQLLRRAERRARQEGLVNVSFEHADVQVHAFGGPGFDVAVSRFGVMFFADPVAAFANVARALRPGGRLAVLCWADALDNQWIAVPGAAAAQYVALPALGDPASPGPFSLADPRRLSVILGLAGLAEAEVEAINEPLLLGSGVTDTVEFLKATGMGRTLLQDADPAAIARITDGIAAALGPHLSPEGVRLGSKAWLATARRPV
jgi:SAM-dependent methyltransferase